MDAPIPDDLARLEAKKNPGGWVYVLDLNYGSDPTAAFPPEAIKGAWKVSESGEMTGEFFPNPHYRPLTPRG